MSTAEASQQDSWLDETPSLRRDLLFTPRCQRGRPGYVVEDRIRGKFYRLGVTEYAFIAQLDGTKSAREAIAAAIASAESPTMTPETALGLLRWLQSMQLLQTSHMQHSASPSAAESSGEPRARPRWWMSPLFIRVPLLEPSRLLNHIYPWARFVASRWFAAVTLMLCIVAAGLLGGAWGRFTSTLSDLFTPLGSLQLILAWVALKSLHEAAHGLVCRHYGAHSREAGVMLLLFLPIPYVDVTSSWRLSSRFARVHIAAAGMIVELFVASLAIFVWMSASPGAVQQLAAHVAIAASVTTLLFNANPLMRFDGYYILTDLLDLPNLYTHSQSWFRWQVRRWVMGIAQPGNCPRLAMPTFMKTYAVAAAAWRVFVYCSLLIAAAMLFRGAGIVLAVFAAGTWFGLPTYRWIRRIASEKNADRRPQWLYFASATSVLVATSTAILVAVPWPGAARAVAIVDYSHRALVRTTSDAWLDVLLVQPGQRVRKNQVLCRLRNDELRNQAALLDTRISNTELAVRKLKLQRELAAFQSQQERLAALRLQRAELAKQIAELTVRAPINGRVVSANIDRLLGSYVRKGETLLEIADESQKEIRVAVTQGRLDTVRGQGTASVDIAVSGSPGFTGRLMRINPRASMRPLHQALTAAAGGPLTVQRHVASSDQSPGDTLRLTTPHLEAVVHVDETIARKLRAGQRATVYFSDGRESLGQHLFKTVADWFHTRTGNAI